MPLVTEKQRKKISDTIRDHHLAFMIEVFGPDSVPLEDYKRLSAAGKVKENSQPVQDAATAAVVLGAMGTHMDATRMAKVPVEGSWNAATMDTLGDGDREAVTTAKAKIGEYIKGLGNKIDEKTGHIITDADASLRKQTLGKVQDKIARGVAEKKSVKQIANDLTKVTGEAARNWMVIAQTEVHNMMEDARATTIAQSVPTGSDPLVYKRPRPDACPFCKLLYLKDGVVPRIFRLSDLIANGSNVGRKARKPTLTGAYSTEWKATLGAMHPWCACTLNHMPAGFAFDSKGVLQYVGLKKSEALTVDQLDKALLNHKCGA